MAANADAPSWVVAPITPLTPAQTWHCWNQELDPPAVHGRPAPVPRDPTTINIREPALADVLLQALRHIARLEGELIVARAGIAGQAQGQALAAAIAIDRPAPVMVVPPEAPAPASAAQAAAVQSGSLVALALARRDDAEGRRVRPRLDP